MLVVVGEIEPHEVTAAEHGAERDHRVVTREALARESRDHPDRGGEIIARDEPGALREREHAVAPRAGIDVARADVALDHRLRAGACSFDELAGGPG